MSILCLSVYIYLIFLAFLVHSSHFHLLLNPPWKIRQVPFWAFLVMLQLEQNLVLVAFSVAFVNCLASQLRLIYLYP